MAKIIKSEILIKVICHCVKTVEKKGLSIVFTFACLFIVFTVSCKYCGFFFGGGGGAGNPVAQTNHCHQWSFQLLS
jgi:hypothetical protein